MEGIFTIEWKPKRVHFQQVTALLYLEHKLEIDSILAHCPVLGSTVCACPVFT
jgi:hypothetical protein